MKIRNLMKLSEKTIKIFENFSSINQSILVKQGNKIRTISVMKNILAEAEIKEDFPKNCAIYDLKQFLNGLGLHEDPQLDFSNDKYLVIREGKRKVKYFFADENVIVTPPEKSITLPTQDETFTLEHSQLDKILRAASVYQLPDLSAIGSDNKIRLVVRDKRNDTSNEYSIDVGETEKNFIFNFKVENIKIIPGNYDVVISSKFISQFSNTNYNLNYYIALEPDSTYDI